MAAALPIKEVRRHHLWGLRCSVEDSLIAHQEGMLMVGCCVEGSRGATLGNGVLLVRLMLGCGSVEGGHVASGTLARCLDHLQLKQAARKAGRHLSGAFCLLRLCVWCRGVLCTRRSYAYCVYGTMCTWGTSVHM